MRISDDDILVSRNGVDRDRKNDYDDELLVRCTSGAGMVSFKFLKAEDYEETGFMAMEYFGGPLSRLKNNAKNSELVIVDPFMLKLLYKALAGSYEDGLKMFEADEGGLFGIHFIEGEGLGGKGTYIFILGFRTKRDAKAFIKSGGKKRKKILWDIILNPKEATKFVELMVQKMKKYMPEVVKDLEAEEKEQK